MDGINELIASIKIQDAVILLADAIYHYELTDDIPEYIQDVVASIKGFTKVIEGIGSEEIQRRSKDLGFPDAL